jgi:hypothetical protein
VSGTHGRTEADPAGNTGFWGAIPCEFRHSLVVSKSEERQPGLIAPSRTVKSCKGMKKQSQIVRCQVSSRYTKVNIHVTQKFLQRKLITTKAVYTLN